MSVNCFRSASSRRPAFVPMAAVLLCGSVFVQTAYPKKSVWLNFAGNLGNVTVKTGSTVPML